MVVQENPVVLICMENVELNSLRLCKSKDKPRGMEFVATDLSCGNGDGVTSLD